jgi:hypothetical protein
MQVSAGSGQPPTGPDWVVELAWTGHRCVAYVEPGRRTRLLSSGDVSVTAAYPELAAPLEARSPPRGMVLDGTIVARGEEHAPRARKLQRRSARSSPSDQLIRDTPVDFQVADLLWLDGHSTVELPYRDRRALLDGLGFDSAPVWSTSPLPVSELATMLRIADAKGVDALHARHLGSRYKPGGRSPLWLKVPVPRIRQVVVGGWTPTDPGRPDAIASLLLGVPTGTGLHYVGRVGVAGDQRRQISELRKIRATGSPFLGALPAGAAQGAIWVRPQLVGLVEFTGFAADGRLRLPHWRGPVHAQSGPLDLDTVDDSRWARPSEPPPRRAATPVPARVADPVPVDPAPVLEPPSPASDPVPAEPAGTTTVEVRRLEQHFVYNALNTIAALIRTDPGRARELLFGFADLSRAADQPRDATTTLGRELDAVRGYLLLEQARFGKRLRVELDVDPALHGVPVAPMQVLGAVRDAVQRDIEPRPQGGVLTIAAKALEAATVCELRIAGGSGDPTVIILALGRPASASGT